MAVSQETYGFDSCRMLKPSAAPVILHSTESVSGLTNALQFAALSLFLIFRNLSVAILP